MKSFREEDEILEHHLLYELTKYLSYLWGLSIVALRKSCQQLSTILVVNITAFPLILPIISQDFEHDKTQLSLLEQVLAELQ